MFCIRKVIVLSLVGLIFLPFIGKADNASIYVDSLDVRRYILTPDDTVWFSNYDFNESTRNEVDFELKFINLGGVDCTGATYTYQRISPYTGNDTTQIGGTDNLYLASDKILKFPRLGEGVYRLKFIFPGAGSGSNTEINAYLFNKKIEFEIVPVKCKTDVCISDGSDTCIFTLRNHRYNPKGTRYKMSATKDFGDDILVDEEKPANVQDTFYVIFNGPTGVDFMGVSVTGIYVNPVNKKVNQAVKNWSNTIRKFDKPDLSKIFSFDSTSINDLLGCTELSLNGLAYGEDFNRKYMDDRNEPNFVGKVKFKIEYYRKNSDNAGVVWEKISGDEKNQYVSDSINFIFLESGLYKIKMEAENMCGKDSLNTEDIFKEDGGIIPGTKRLIKIYGNDTRNIEFSKELLCLNQTGGQTLVVRDKSRRFDWEGEPDYDFVIKQIFKDKMGQDSIAEIEMPEEIYTRGAIKNYPALDGNGVDSIDLVLTFKKVGFYEVVLSKESQGKCSAVYDTLRLKVGDIPEFERKDILDIEGNPMNKARMCGIYKYVLPLTIPVDSNFCNLTGYQWKFGKGSQKVDYAALHPVESFLFDSLKGEVSYIAFKVQNQCGWSKQDSIPFFTFGRPDVVLWRDSIPDNDTLCAKREYNYHFKGYLPPKFDIAGYTDSIIKPGMYSSSGTYEEQFIIKNKQLSGCNDTIKSKVYILNPPVFDVLDTVDFCANSISEIRMIDLVTTAEDKRSYKKLEWKLEKPVGGNWETAPGVPDFPIFKGVADNDEVIFSYAVSAGGDDNIPGKGCYDKGNIVLLKHPEPKLTLQDKIVNTCEGETISVSDHMTTTIDDALNLSVKIGGQNWFPKNDDSSSIPDYKCPTNQDSVIIKFLALQLHNYPGKDGCSLQDSVKVYISHPKIQFTKNDTLFSADKKYDFNRIKPYTDTSAVNDLKWYVIRGGSEVLQSVSGNDIFNWKYDFGSETSDSFIKFVLRGKSQCGKSLEDTLTVVYPGAKLIVKELKLCSNAGGEYKLWSEVPDAGYVSGFFVDPSSLSWEILGQKEGELTGMAGPDVIYKLPKDVKGSKIVIKARAKDVWGHELTPVNFDINIHQVPKLVFKNGYTDHFVLAGNDSLIIADVAELKNAGPSAWTPTDHIRPGTGTYYPVYDDHFKSYSDTLICMMISDDKSVCGTGLYKDSIYLDIHPNPQIRINPDTLKMCFGDQLMIGDAGNGTIEVQADPDAIILWKTKNNCSGCLNPSADYSKVEYQPEIAGFEKLYLQASKSVVNYKSETKRLFAVDSIVVRAFEEPHFEVTKRRDTICYDAFAVDLSYIQILNPENYKLDFQAEAGLTFVSHLHYNMAVGIDSAKIYIRPKLDGCSKWEDKKDSIVVTRLRELNASIAMPSKVCSNAELMIAGNVNTPVYTWETAHGGLLTGTNTLQPVYHPVDGVYHDEIILKALPLLAKCTDYKEARSPVTIVAQPLLEWKDDTICSSEETYSMLSEGIEENMIQSINWSTSSSGIFKSGENTVSPVYQISDEERNNGEVIFTAKILLKDPCTGVGEITRQVELTIMQTPYLEVDGSLITPLCQGDSLDISFNAIPAIYKYQWNVSAGRLSADNVAHPRYYAEGNAGFAQFSVTLTGNTLGTHFCVSTPQTFVIEVKEAPVPDIVVDQSVCKEAEVLCQTNTQAIKYTWQVAGEPKQFLQQAAYSFDEEGEKVIGLMVEYPNGCRRDASEVLTVLPKPQAKFKPDSVIVGINKTIYFENQTQDITKQWWYVDRVNKSTEVDLNYEFTSGDSYEVGLEVQNSVGCKDTVYQVVWAILKPKADFSVVLENPAKPCDGSLAIFENHTLGEKEYFSYRWVLSTPHAGVDTTAEIPDGEVRYYASNNQDTAYRVALIVENAAGADTAYQMVTIVSHIKAKLELVNGSTLCPGFDKEVMNYTLGTADWYTIEWGDGCDTVFTDKGSRFLAKHKYSNNTYEVVQHKIKLCAGNVCEEDCSQVTVKISPNSAVAKIRVDEQIGSEGCYMFEPKFHNISTGFGGTKKSLWNFGEGDPWVENTNESVTNLFEKPGVYKVLLKIFDACNTSLDSVKITVKGNDKLKFNLQENIYCSGQALHMAVDSDIKDQFYEYSWNFNYNKPEGVWIEANKTEVSRILPSGTYQVAVKAKSLDGCEVYSPYFKELTVHRSPMADLEFRYVGEQVFHGRNEVIAGCAPLKLDLRSIGAMQNDVVFWDFRDGGTSQERSLQHDFTTIGTTNLKLSVTSAEGCVDSLIKELTVKKSPEAMFVNQAGNLFCNDGNVLLDVENIGTDQGNTTYLWSYNRPGDSEDVFWDDKAEPAFLKLENVYGKVTLKLKATHQQSGCTAERTDTLISSPALSHHFEIREENLCDGEEVHFQFFPKVGEQVVWNLGDASSEVKENQFNYIYDGPGQYHVVLKVRNAYGCEGDTTKTITVYPLPIADFSYKEDYSAIENLPEGVDISKLPRVPNGGIRFTNHSSVASYHFTDNRLNSYWDFGDGSLILQGQDVLHHFVNNGLYEIKLLTKTWYGCADSVSKNITIEAVKGLFIPNAFAPGAGIEANPGIALFQPKGIGLISYKIQVYDESGTCVWSSTKLENGHPAESWDGTFKGQPLPKNLYTWKVSAVFIDGTVWEDESGRVNGRVMLIR